jgi:ADP-ribosyl-[dinitrogen reductase] hydrolase
MTTNRNLDEHQLDRAFGSVLGSAAGDALGSQYEFGPTHPDSMVPYFGVGFFGHAEGEWTDDTSMAVPILEWAAGKGVVPLRSILERWIDWSRDSKDVGAQTSAVLTALKPSSPTLEQDALDAAARVARKTGRSGGNGSLMRVGPFALSSLQADGLDLVTLRSVVEWTHYEEDNFIACALWSDAIRTAILTGKFDMRESLERLGLSGNQTWATRIDVALDSNTHPRDFAGNNGWVVAAFQAALSAVVRSSSLEEALYIAIRGGGDTDTVAAIAGSLAGAVYGASAVPGEWRTLLHGWPGYSLAELEELVTEAVS